jgi:diaminopimelate epimerase
MTQIHKMHGTANDFIVVDARGVRSHDWSAAAMRLCDRHRGIGADGVLLVDNAMNADFEMRLFNADGSEAEMCGNGIRCTAKFVLDTGMTTSRQLTWATGAGPVETEVVEYGERVARVRVDMGAPRLRPADIPVIADGDDALRLPTSVKGTQLRLSCVGMGNPHAVAFVESVAAFPLGETGPTVENLAIFPERTNFEVAEIVARDHVRMRVWERGVGETMACGTGACAVAVASQLVHGASPALEIDVPGGRLGLEWRPGESVFLTGPAETVFTTELGDAELGAPATFERSLKQPA